MKIYTRTGDDGETGLFAGGRVAKDHARIEAYGTVDELNAALGVARAAQSAPELDSLLEQIQHQLFVVGAELATPKPEALRMDRIAAPHVGVLELAIDSWEEKLEPLRQFILPAGPMSAATLHMARTICRRAERRVVTLRRLEDNQVSVELVHYLNRLGDLLFVLARSANRLANQPDVAWKKLTP